MDLITELERLRDLHRSGALTDDAFAAAVDAAGRYQDQIEALTRENAALRFDRQWADEREAYLVSGDRLTGGDQDRRFIPTRSTSMWGGGALAALGIGLIVLGKMGNGDSNGGNFLFVGLIILVIGFAVNVGRYNKAIEYEAAEKAYRDRRARLLAGEAERPMEPPAAMIK